MDLSYKYQTVLPISLYEIDILEVRHEKLLAVLWEEGNRVNLLLPTFSKESLLSKKLASLRNMLAVMLEVGMPVISICQSSCFYLCKIAFLI